MERYLHLDSIGAVVVVVVVADDGTRQPACRAFVDDITVMTPICSGDAVDSELVGKDGRLGTYAVQTWEI